MKEDFKKQKIEIARKAENLERQLSEARRKIKECEQLNEELLDKITNERGKQREEHPVPGTSRSLEFKGIVIGDSNSRRIAPHFKRENTWDIAENTYVTRDAERIRSERTYDVAVYLLGTNDVKIGKDGKKEAEYLMDTVEKSSIARNKFIIELPPINRKGKEAERRLFNRTLHKLNISKKITIIRMVPEIEETPIEQALQDDLHLNNNNATQMARQIERIVEKKIAEEREDTGRKPKHPRDTREEGATSRNPNEQREEWKNIKCRYHLQGRCYRGEFCFYNHDQEGNNRSNEGIKERSSRNETRQKSRDRHENRRSKERRSPHSRDRRNTDRDQSPRNKERRTSRSGERRHGNRDRSPSRDRRTIIDIRSVKRLHKNE